ncbi:site-2 protease family protein [Pseudalkalibacillus caeni]|uniref:Peptidase M50 domain-containing protein n=1 Tax=Exobacillus caeni TaxID=2574798 RepID=A0A5R9F3U6_9BACL|nr:site-2 protease family protein [Pseudalkalibacillus caeni]TLS37671.1 hypothetical protein FCL54_07545 [Pseudalkalibacillus caeni]
MFLEAIWFMLFVVPATIFLHETGHLIVAKVLKIKGLRMVLGTGPLLIEKNTLDVAVEIRLLYFAGGYSTTHSKGSIHKWKQGLISIGGPLINLFFCYGLMQWLDSRATNSFLQLLFLFNLWVGIINLIPFRIKGKESDGWNFIKNVLKPSL